MEGENTSHRGSNAIKKDITVCEKGEPGDSTISWPSSQEGLARFQRGRGKNAKLGGIDTMSCSFQNPANGVLPFQLLPFSTSPTRLFQLHRMTGFLRLRFFEFTPELRGGFFLFFPIILFSKPPLVKPGWPCGLDSLAGFLPHRMNGFLFLCRLLCVSRDKAASNHGSTQITGG